MMINEKLKFVRNSLREFQSFMTFTTINVTNKLLVCLKLFRVKHTEGNTRKINNERFKHS